MNRQIKDHVKLEKDQDLNLKRGEIQHQKLSQVLLRLEFALLATLSQVEGEDLIQTQVLIIDLACEVDTDRTEGIAIYLCEGMLLEVELQHVERSAHDMSLHLNFFAE